MPNPMDGGDLDKKEKREFCPNLTTASDVVNRVGSLTVEILNKEKVIGELWSQIDKVSAENSGLKDASDTLTSRLEILEKDIETHKRLIDEAEQDKIAELSKYKKAMELNKVELESKDAEIKGLKSTLDSIEGAAVTNQEELRGALMITRKELRELKKKPSTVKKKANSKPARA
jgi:chromosome segregation ATPase